MGIEQAVTRLLVSWLPNSNQERMATDVVSWLASNLPPAPRQKAIQDLAPKLLERIREEQFGLSVVAYYHFLRLPFLRDLYPPFAPDWHEAEGRSIVVGTKA